MKRNQIKYNEELFYVLGALLGDSCIYNWRENYQVWLMGDENFTKKYAEKLSMVINRTVKNYFNKGHYKKYGISVWFVKIDNPALFLLFREIRKDLNKIINLTKDEKNKKLKIIEGFFDAEGCVKVIKEKVRKTPKICLDITNTNYELLELIKNLLKENLGIEARYSSQEAFLGKDGYQRQKVYHLRIYKKEYVRRFLENISTTKLKSEKIEYVNNWLNNGK